MDPLTHALASYATARAFFPRASRKILFAALAAGTLADADRIAVLLGPSAWLRVQGSWLHSLPGALLLAAMVAGVFLVLPRGKTQPQTAPLPRAPLFAAAGLGALLHVALDLCQSDGVALLWPLSARRTALDWTGATDPWILALLLAGVLFPALLRLVTEEIGAKEKGPRGRAAAVWTLAAICACLGARGVLHERAVALMDACTYRGELPLRVAAFPETLSPFRWRGIVETRSALHLLALNAGPGAALDPEAALDIFKPEPTKILEAAQNTESARRFLAVARFPKATMEKTPDGYRVELHDLRYAAAGNSERAMSVFVLFNSEGTILEQGIVWETAARR
ncbi:MAG: metal-dependent hydrolase [Acidobacteriia bacterium]|nr:metal-dependent hydrolase [Terriglobia bacterium]